MYAAGISTDPNARNLRGSLWERASPRSSHRIAGHRPCRCSRACPLPQGSRQLLEIEQDSCSQRSRPGPDCAWRTAAAGGGGAVAQRSVLARSVGAGEPAKQPPRCKAPALPVFADMPAPTEVVYWSSLCSPTPSPTAACASVQGMPGRSPAGLHRSRSALPPPH